MNEHITQQRWQGGQEVLPFGVTCKFVTKDRDAVDGATRLKVGLDVFGRRTIIDLDVQEYLGEEGKAKCEHVSLTFPTKTLLLSINALSSSVSIAEPSSPSGPSPPVELSAAACSSRSFLASRSISSTRCFMRRISWRGYCDELTTRGHCLNEEDGWVVVSHHAPLTRLPHCHQARSRQWLDRWRQLRPL
jgi:hypothetical protein